MRFPTVNLKATGANIATLRKKQGITVRQMQEYFGFEQPQAIYKWQRGESLPTVDNLFALSKLLHTSIDGILVGNDQDFCVIIKIRAIRFMTLEAICDVMDCQPGDILEYQRE